jgi:hypothetical protein
VIDCSTFHDCEVDALYSEPGSRELDEEASSAMAEHVATCAACAKRYARLRGMRSLVLSVAVEAVPRDFESRIMAAVDAGLAQRASSAGAAPAAHLAAVPGPAAAPLPSPPRAPAAPAEGGAKIFRFMARPSFAVAAGFLLVLGAGTLILVQGARSPKSAALSADEAPAMAAAPAAPAPAERAVAPAVAIATVAAPAVAGSVADDPNAGAVALAEAPAPKPMAFAKSARPAAKPSAVRADDPAFTAAKSLYAAGRYAEALPKFEALTATHPEAELYAARCIAKTRGCAAAEPRFDSAAQSNAGTEIGNRAQIEGARCYQQTGDLVSARKRYEAAKDEGSAEATKALEALDGRTGPGAGGGAHAAPKAAAPVARPPAAEPASPPKR